MDTPNRVVLAVVPDLFFATKIAATARVAGVALELVPPQRAAERAARPDASLVLLDLHAAGALALLAALKAADPARPVVGFHSHVEIALRRDAIAAGADAVLPRSAFVQRLPDLLVRGMAALGERQEGT